MSQGPEGSPETVRVSTPPRYAISEEQTSLAGDHTWNYLVCCRCGRKVRRAPIDGATRGEEGTRARRLSARFSAGIPSDSGEGSKQNDLGEVKEEPD